MQLTENTKNSVLAAIVADFSRKSEKDSRISQTRHANYLGINPSVYSRLMKGDTDRLLSEGEWIRVGMELGVDMDGMEWRTAQTATFSIICAQLDYCRSSAIAGIFCDEKGIGKTYAARHFARTHPNVAYVDCSQCKTKRELLRAIARKFGFEYRGKLAEVRQNMIDNVLTLDKPLLILDEVGDLNYDAWLELKSIWNALEYMCGFYMMGANGLRVKIDRQIHNRKVGFEEIFDRYGDRYQSVYASLTDAEKAAFKRHQAEAVLRANLPRLNKEEGIELLNSSALNLRRLRIEIIKHKNHAA